EKVRMVMKLEMISVDEIQPNPFQPRESFEKESLKELADSIKDAGIIQPIVVRRHGFSYQIIAGERRWRAAQMVGLEKIPCIVKEIDDERVLLESLIENLHRKNLTDIERENAIYGLWENREDLGFKSKSELARAIGVPPQNVDNDLEAWEFRHKEEGISPSTPTYIISRSRGLPVEERKKVVEKVQKGELKAQEAYTAIKVLRKAPEGIKKELLKSKPHITPKMAETIVTKLPAEEEQNLIVEEIKRLRLTEDEVEDRVREIQHAKETGKPPTKEIGVKEGPIHIVREYDCPYCKKHYVIKCDGKRDWLE
ncbi:ParB/RepB/Spo0J family partition protein, partial [Candidatus Bathyarchaeota archaeon]|nr:ParB/RepB/Spo0J family partition protein [Candidatus Bathyarchaeota archaeon]